MKHLYSILILLILTASATAQDSLALRQQHIFHYLNDSTESRIDFGCGWAGTNSDNLYLLKELIANRRFDILSKLVDSKTASTRYLAISTLLLVDKKSISKLDKQTALKIDSLKNDTAPITFCSGCTGHWAYSTKDLLGTKSNNTYKQKSIEYLSGWTKTWIKDGLHSK